MIKRICAAAAGAALVLPCLCGAAAQNGTAYYTADGTRLAPDGSAYRLADGRELRFDAEWPALRIGEGIDEKLMVPLRKASEAFDATVYWFNDTQVIQIVGNDRRLNLKIDSNTIDIYRIENNTTSFVKFLTMPEAARLINDTTTYVPLRAAADPLFADWATITAEDVVSIEDLKNKNPERAIQYADGTPATVTMPRVDIPPAAGLLQVTGTLRADGGGWKLVEDSGTEWTITNIPNDPSVPIDPAIFWSQQLDGIANPDGIRITMTACLLYTSPSPRDCS